MNGTSWLSALYDSSFLISFVVDVVVLACVIPAYKRTKHVAFLYLMFSYLLAILGTTSDHTLGHWLMTREQYIQYRTIRSFSHFAVNILLAAGIISFARTYCSMFRSRDEAQPPI